MNESIKTADAIELAYAFAEYKSVRVIDLDSEMDCKLAEGATRRLRRCQDEVGVHLVDTDKLLATEKRMVRYAKVLASQV
jgi:hypothetical protein